MFDNSQLEYETQTVVKQISLRHEQAVTKQKPESS